MDHRRSLRHMLESVQTGTRAAPDKREAPASAISEIVGALSDDLGGKSGAKVEYFNEEVQALSLKRQLSDDLWMRVRTAQEGGKPCAYIDVGRPGTELPKSVAEYPEQLPGTTPNFNDPYGALHEFGTQVKHMNGVSFLRFKQRLPDAASVRQLIQELKSVVEFVGHSKKFQQVGADVAEGSARTHPLVSHTKEVPLFSEPVPTAEERESIATRAAFDQLASELLKAFAGKRVETLMPKKENEPLVLMTDTRRVEFRVQLDTDGGTTLEVGMYKKGIERKSTLGANAHVFDFQSDISEVDIIKWLLSRTSIPVGREVWSHIMRAMGFTKGGGAHEIPAQPDLDVIEFKGQLRGKQDMENVARVVRLITKNTR